MMVVIAKMGDYNAGKLWIFFKITVADAQRLHLFVRLS